MGEMNRLCNLKLLENNLVGQSLPDYEFVNIEGANKYSELTKGRVLLIVFLTTCQACLKEFDVLEQQHNETNSNFKIFAITGESSQIVKNFAEERKLKFPIYLDVKGSLMLKMRVSCTPTMLFLENGIVRGVKVGITENYEKLTEVFKS